MLYILAGADDFSINEELAGIKKSLGDASLLDTNTTLLEGHQLTPGQLQEASMTMPFLAPKRLVIVRGLLERFQPKQGRKPKKEKNSQSQDYRAFATLADGLPESTVLVLIDGEVKQKNPLLKELLPKSQFRTFPLLRNNALRQWIQQRIKKESGSIFPPAVALLEKLVGSNLWIMVGEISKLISFAWGRRIEEEDVRQVVGYSQQVNIFNMVDAVLEFRAGPAQQAIQQLLNEGLTPPYLLFMMVRQARMLIRAKDMTKTGKSAYEIQQRLLINSDFVWRKTSEQASRYSLGRLKELYHRLLEADIAIKTGQYEPELALNILAAEICRQG
ncbi:DNA polymerase III subunit delta [Chloroflexota bacterium]